MIEKYWLNKNEEGDKIILIANKIIYKGNPKPREFIEYSNEIKSNIIPKGMFGIPYSYLKKIELEEGKDYIEIYFSSDSTERINMKKDNKRKEIFDYFKENIPDIHYELERYSPIKSAQKPIIATIVIGAIYAVSLFMAIEMENGDLYGEYPLILLGLAGLGTLKLTIIFGSFLFFAIINMFIKLMNPPVIHTLY